MSPRTPRIVVIGGGFSGAAFAIHLLRDHPDLRAELTIVEPRARLGAGLAYGTADPQHRINVAASRMALFAEDPTHFHRWLEAGGEAARDPAASLPDGRLYPQRSRFGAYMAETLAALAAGAADRVTLRHIADRAVAIAQEDAGFVVTLADGRRCAADRLVLALAHPPPARPAFLRAVPEHLLVADPWAEDALAALAPGAHVLIVGTGLTACDVIASLAARGHRGPITALSRHGLLPRPRTEAPVEAYGDFATAPAVTALALLRRIRATVAELRGLGRPWEDAIDALRRDARVLWRALPRAEKRRLLRHARAFWDVHRFQAAPQIDATIARLRESGRLRILAGRLHAVAPAGPGLRALWTQRHGAGGALDVDVVVNCTGPGHGSILASSPVLASLAASGLVREDGLGLGLDVTPANHPVGADGSVHPALFVAGPLARSAHGELMGLPQVAAQPREIAHEIARHLAGAEAQGYAATTKERS